MPTFTIQVPDGRKITLSAADQASAIAGAQDYVSKNPAPAQNAMPQTQPDNSPGAIASQGLSGINEGIAGTLGAPVDLTNDALRGAAAAVHALGGPDIQLPTNVIGGKQFFENIMAPTIGAPPQGGPQEFARRAGEDVGAAAIPSMGVAATASRPLASALLNMGTSLMGGIGAGGADQAANMVAPGNAQVQRYADLAGESLGDIAGMKIPGAISRAITPFPVAQDPVSQARLAAARSLQGQGVDLTAGQITGNKPLQYAESELGGGQGINNAQNQQFTQRALQIANIPGQLASPDVLASAAQSFNSRFRQLEAQSTIMPDQQLGAELKQARDAYKSVVAPTFQAPVIDDALKDVQTYAKAGQITGPQYQDLSSRLTGLIGKTDGPLNGALKDIKAALDNAAQRTAAATNPQLAAQWQQTRQDYANFMRIQQAASGAGANAADGLISPASLRSAVASNNQAAYTRGNSDLGNLARSGVSALTPLPQSGTAPRMAVHAIPTAIGAALGGLLGGHIGGPVESGLVGATAGAMAPPLMGKALMSKPMQAYLANQLMAGQAPVKNGFAGPLSAALIAQAGMQ